MKAAASVLALILCGMTACAQKIVPSSAPIQQAAVEPGKVKLTYVGNEGVLISDGTQSVLIDGLHREYNSSYLFPPPEVLGAMEAARAPFDTVRVVLVSHVHGDHFHPESVGLHLRNNPKATLVSSAQTMIDVARSYPGHEAIRAQMHEVTPEWKGRAVYEKDGIKVTVLGLKHGSDRFWWIKNLGHIIEIGGKKLFHFGDADMTVENFASFNLPAQNIDVAFVPYWFLLSEGGRKIVSEQIRAKNNIAVHVSPGSAQADAENVRKLFPGVEAFTVMGQSISY